MQLNPWLFRVESLYGYSMTQIYFLNLIFCPSKIIHLYFKSFQDGYELFL